MHATVALGFLLVFGFAQPARAQNASTNQTDQLTIFKNYLVTGNYVVGGVGLRGLGDPTTNLATRTIIIPDANSVPATGVPAGAEIKAAFLYWETVESPPVQSSQGLPQHPGQNGFFNGHAITGRILGNPNAPTSWSSGGCSGSSSGAKTIVAYRADVRPFLNVVNGTVQGNGSYQVSLADSGSNGGGIPLTLGATLVLIYEIPSDPLTAVVIYDGAFAPSNQTSGNLEMSQTVQGFYQPAGSPAAKLTHIVGDGQPNKAESVFLNDKPLPNLYPALSTTAWFPGFYNGSWDNPTWPVGNLVNGSMPPLDTSARTSVVPGSSGGGCVDWGAVVFSTTVQQSDKDGLVDVWKANQGYTDLTTGEFVSLLGATSGEKDLFVQLDWLASHDFITSHGISGHSHKIKQGALDMVGDMFAAQGIHLHVDCGNCYPGDPYVIPGGLGGNVIDEDIVTCQDNAAATPPFFCGFPGQPVTSWKGGFTALKNLTVVNGVLSNQPCSLQTPPGTNCLFQHGRQLSYREGLFAHALGVGTDLFSTSKGTLISIVVSGGTATVTTSSPHGLNSGNRVRVSGAISPVYPGFPLPPASPLPPFGQDFTLNGTYPNITVTAPTAFTFPTAANVPAGTYNNPGLFVESGPAQSISGWADKGADFIVTLGLWRSDVPGDDQVGSVHTQAGTFAHELGHNLGLNHGGDDSINCKSNYESVMNYQFQVRLLPGFDGFLHVNYSGQVLPELNEGGLGLNESLGIGPSPTYRTRWFAPFGFLNSQLNTVVGGRAATRHCDGTRITDGAQMVRLEGPLVPGAIDWNNDGNITDTSLAQDINFNGTLDSIFHGFNDWANLDLRRIGARRGVFGFSEDVWGTLDDGTGGTLDDGTGGTLDDGTGGTLDDGTGGTLDDGTGGMESDFDRANSTVDPPTSVTCSNCASSSGSLIGGKSVSLTWTPPDFGQIRTYFIWRANTTNGPISPTNLPVNIGTVKGTPPNTTFTDNNVKNGNTYTYFVTAALGAASGPNSGNQSGPSNMVTVTINFSF